MTSSQNTLAAAHRILHGLAEAEEHDASAAWYQFVSADDVETVARAFAQTAAPEDS